MNRFGDITDMLLQGLFLQLNTFSDEEDAVFFRKDISYLSPGRETGGSHCPIKQSSQSSRRVIIVRQRHIPPLSNLCAVVVKYSSFSSYTF